MSNDTNKEIALGWMEAAVVGDVDKSRGYFDENCKFLVVGEMPFCGWMDLKGFMDQTQVLTLAGPITMKVGTVVADGEHVWFEAESNAKLASGKDYNNVYVFLMRIRNGKILEYKEFSDTLHVWRQIDSPETRGGFKPRGQFVTQTTHEFRGNTIGVVQREGGAA